VSVQDAWRLSIGLQGSMIANLRTWLPDQIFLFGAFLSVAYYQLKQQQQKAAG
jgi:hypothetical protein